MDSRRRNSVELWMREMNLVKHDNSNDGGGAGGMQACMHEFKMMVEVVEVHGIL